MKKVIGVLFMLTFVIWGAYRVVANIQFGQDCEGHLKRAADANTIELAKGELEVALKYLEDNRMTEGYTSIVYETPDEDVEFWHKNLTASLQELKDLSPDVSGLERSNMLIKLRETLLDESGNRTTVTYPSGMSVFPNNTLVALLGIITSILALVGGILFLRDFSAY